MSYLILQLTRCRSLNLNRYILQKCLNQLNPRLYCIDNNDAYNKRQELKKLRKARRKEIKARLIQDIKQTRQKVEKIIERENIWTVPNFLCIGRILSTPFLGYLIVSQDYQVLNFL